MRRNKQTELMKHYVRRPEQVEDYAGVRYIRVKRKLYTELMLWREAQAKRGKLLTISDQIKLEALCEFLGRDLEEWKTEKEKERDGEIKGYYQNCVDAETKAEYERVMRKNKLVEKEHMHKSNWWKLWKQGKISWRTLIKKRQSNL